MLQAPAGFVASLLWDVLRRPRKRVPARWASPRSGTL
jgi:hypothetical protein